MDTSVGRCVSPCCARLLELIEAGDGAGAASMPDEHLARARELLAASLGGEAGPEAFVPSSALVAGGR